MNAVMELIESDPYTSVERGTSVLKKLSSSKKYDEATTFIPEILNRFSELNLWEYASVVADRVVSIYPEKFIKKKKIKLLLIEFALKVPKEGATEQYYSFVDNFSRIAGDMDDKLFNKKVGLSIEAHQYFHSQLFILKRLAEISGHTNEESFVDSLLNNLVMTTWEYILSFNDDIYTAQFALARVLLCLLVVDDDRSSYYKKFYEWFSNYKAEKSIESDILETHLVRFCNMYRKACEARSKVSLNHVVEKYQPLLRECPELDQLLKQISVKLFPSEPSIVQRIISAFFQPARNGQ